MKGSKWYQKRGLPWLIVIALIFGLAPASIGSAAKKVSLSSKKLTITVGKSKKLKLKNNKKKVKWTVVSGSKNIKLKAKKKTGVTIVAKKRGKAKVQAKVGKKKYSCTVTVRAKNGPSADEEEEPDDDSGYDGSGYDGSGTDGSGSDTSTSYDPYGTITPDGTAKPANSGYPSQSLTPGQTPQPGGGSGSGDDYGSGGGSGSGGDYGSGGDSGSGGDYGSGGDSGSGGDYGSGGDSGSGDDYGSGGDSGSGGDYGSGGDSGSGGDYGSGGDSGSGGDYGSGGDSGSGDDYGSGGDSGSGDDYGSGGDSGSGDDYGSGGDSGSGSGSDSGWGGDSGSGDDSGSGSGSGSGETSRATATPKATTEAKATATPKATATASPKATTAPTATPKATATPTKAPTATPTATPKATTAPTAAPTTTQTPSSSGSSGLTGKTVFTVSGKELELGLSRQGVINQMGSNPEREEPTPQGFTAMVYNAGKNGYTLIYLDSSKGVVSICAVGSVTSGTVSYGSLVKTGDTLTDGSNGWSAQSWFAAKDGSAKVGNGAYQREDSAANANVLAYVDYHRTNGNKVYCIQVYSKDIDFDDLTKPAKCSYNDEIVEALEKQTTEFLKAYRIACGYAASAYPFDSVDGLAKVARNWLKTQLPGSETPPATQGAEALKAAIIAQNWEEGYDATTKYAQITMAGCSDSIGFANFAIEVKTGAGYIASGTYHCIGVAAAGETKQYACMVIDLVDNWYDEW